MFRATNSTIYKTQGAAALKTTTVRSPSVIQMITEKEWNSPSKYLTDSGEWQAWLDAWNATSGKNYPNSGLGRHSKYLPVLLAADGHTDRWQVPTYNPSSSATKANPYYFPGLSDARLDPANSLRQGPGNYYMRDFAIDSGF